MSSEFSSIQGKGLPATYFAPAERADQRQVNDLVEKISRNPVIDTVLASYGGVLAVLNEQRQILAVNKVLLQSFGVTDPEKMLGLRPGEAMQCIHAHDHPGGCGTSKFCSTCGAAISIVTVLADETPQERECILTLNRGGRNVDLDFVVRSVLLEVEGQKLILLMLRDVSMEKRRGALERTFFHDIANLLMVLAGTADKLSKEYGQADSVHFQRMQETLRQLNREVQLQRAMIEDRDDELHVDLRTISVHELVKHVQQLIQGHQSAVGQHLEVVSPERDCRINTDPAMLSRVLMNMLINAFEAGRQGDVVRLWVERSGQEIIFKVWNRQVVPETARMRIFQRYYSTKDGPGRGLGTFSMKLLGETILKGAVGFDSTAETGTTFHITLPMLCE